ncbi:MAG TPA: PilC/PilY family type IV pilus protein, partial [Thermoanaerobaculia bacterium]|nr:PilC/PilY family type IV pilus protein [Thermoanaerobaculia bacterium]
MRPRRPAGWKIQLAAAAGAVALSWLGAVGPLSADDRDFVRKTAEDPYVFILFDVSGSMNWTTHCTQAQLDAGDCRQRCDTSDCFARLSADDPASKFYQAKEALHEVLSQVDNVNFGFGTYNQDDLGLRAKHWLYRQTSAGVLLGDGVSRYPAVGSEDVFGLQFTCDLGNGDEEVGCTFNTPADVNDGWEVLRTHRLAKLGDRPDQVDQPTTVWVRANDGSRYRVTYSRKTGQTLGSPSFTARVDVDRCTSATNCPTQMGGGPLDVTYTLVDEFIEWENCSTNAAGNCVGDASRVERQMTFFSTQNQDSSASDTCAGWDPNAWNDAVNTYEDVNDDLVAGCTVQDSNCNLRFPTTVGDARGKHFYTGDVIPLDWKNDHRTEIMRRLSPTGLSFDQSPFFFDHPNSGETFLRLRNKDNRPLLATGSTPLGDSIKSFRTWYAGCPQGNCPHDSGWKDIAAVQDSNWGCRKRYLVVVTDGDESCGGGASACSGTASLRAQEGILTYVVAFGVQSGGGNSLTCMAANGGTGQPIFPQNKQDLVDALLKILTEVKEEARAFASAAVPSVEANVRDKIFLSDFTPLSDESIWDGHLDGFLKPLPELPDGSPNDTPAADCGTSGKANCHLWDTGDKLTQQAPDLPSPVPPALDTSTLRLTLQPLDRRVYYPGADNVLKPFAPPTGGSDVPWIDLFKGFGFKDYGAGPPTLGANKTRANAIIGRTLTRKHATVNLPSGGTQAITYVMGDIFHSDPLVTESPHDLIDFDAAAEPAVGACRLSGGALPGKGSSSNYRCFASKEQYRRKLVIVGANDSQLHAFDAGTFDANKSEFTSGTGREAFAVIPRQMLPVVREQAEGNQHIFGVDGPVVSSDVYYAADDQWHTIAVVGMREAGRKLTGVQVSSPENGATGAEAARFGYMALDVTQPDPLREEPDPRQPGLLRRFVPKTTGSVPGCAVLDSTLDAGCVRPFPSLLWEFTDRSPDTGEPLDEDGNGDGDLGAPWSKAIVTRVRLAGGTVLPVVIVGGGLDPANKRAIQPRFGNFLYILDARTGVPIYKREVEGSVPMVAALDVDQDNIADYLYFGTTAGRIYKVDLTTKPVLVNTTVRDRFGKPVAGTTVSRVPAANWNPFLVFQTGENHAVYEEIQLLAVRKLGRYALAFGTGDRENLWEEDSAHARFYVIVDDGWTAATGFDEDDYLRILPGDSQLTDNPNTTENEANPLLAPTGGRQRGWYIYLDANERVITEAFGVSGVLIFSSFVPDIQEDDTQQEPVCVRTGTSRNFIVFATNANAVTNLAGSSALDRYIAIQDFVTSPFVEQVQTQNVTGGGGQPQPPIPFDADCNGNARL